MTWLHGSMVVAPAMAAHLVPHCNIRHIAPASTANAVITDMTVIGPQNICNYPDSKVHGANMGPIWGRQDPGGPYVGPINFVVWVPSVWSPSIPSQPASAIRNAEVSTEQGTLYTPNSIITGNVSPNP